MPEASPRISADSPTRSSFIWFHCWPSSSQINARELAAVRAERPLRSRMKDDSSTGRASIRCVRYKTHASPGVGSARTSRRSTLTNVRSTRP